MSMKFDPAQLSFWLGEMAEAAEPRNSIKIGEIERTDDIFEYHVELPDGTQMGLISTEGGEAALSATLISILYTLGYEVSVYRN